MIPSFTSEGLLPVGHHHATISDVYHKLVSRRSFPDSETRKQIFLGFCAYNKLLTPYNLILDQYLDGSFVTAKTNPADIDIINFYDGEKYEKNYGGCDFNDMPVSLLHQDSKSHNQKLFRTHPLPVPVYLHDDEKFEEITAPNEQYLTEIFTTSATGQKKGIIVLDKRENDFKRFEKFNRLRDKILAREGETPMDIDTEGRPAEHIRQDMEKAYGLLKMNRGILKKYPDNPSVRLMVHSAQSWLFRLLEEYKLLKFADNNIELYLLAVDNEDIKKNQISIKSIGDFLKKLQDSITGINEHIAGFKGNSKSVRHARSLNPHYSSLWYEFAMSGSVVFAFTDTDVDEKNEIAELKQTRQSIVELYRLIDLSKDKNAIKQELVRYAPKTIKKLSSFVIEVKQSNSTINIALPKEENIYEISPDMIPPAIEAFSSVEEPITEERREQRVGVLMALDMIELSFRIEMPPKNKKKKNYIRGFYDPSLQDSIALFMGKSIEAGLKVTQKSIWSDEKDDFVFTPPSYYLESIKSPSQKELFSAEEAAIS